MRVSVLAVIAVLAGGCSDTLKAAGEQCFGSSECEDGLTCDFGQDPPVCASSQTPLPDAMVAPVIDAAPMIDADPNQPDADPTQPDADVTIPDAAVPDAALPDAAIPDAAVPDAGA